MYSYDEVYQATLDYFGGSNELAAKICVDKYLLRDTDGNFMERTPDDMHRRIARELARVERNKFKVPLTEDEIYGYLKDFRRIIPQGSPMYGIGNPYQYVTLSNCYVTPPVGDSFGAIHRTDEYISQIAKRRGGQGFDLSPIRPAGFVTRNSSRTATGVVSFMERFSNSGREVGAEGRRAALMLTISVHHPDIVAFIESKKDRKKVTGANISVRYTDEFLKAVENDEEYEQRWPVDSNTPLFTRMVKARDVWKIVVENAHENAEPGVLMWDSIIRESVADIYALEGFLTQGTNPCITSDMWIHTESGPQKVSSLIGKPFRAIVNGQIYDSSEEGFWSTGVKDVWLLETDRGFHIKCTENHLVKKMTSSGWKWTPVSELRLCDGIVLSNHRDHNTWQGVGTTDQGWLLGSCLGDGCVQPSKGLLDFWGETKEFMHEFASECLKRTVKCRPDLGKSAKSGFTFDEKDKMRVGSAGLRDLIDEFDLNEKQIGKKIEAASSDFCIGILRGWFDADGTVHADQLKGNHVRLGSVNLNNLYAAQRILARLGIQSTIYRNRKEAGLRLLPDGRGGLKEYYCQEMNELHIAKDNLIHFAEIINFVEPIKKKTLDDMISKYTKGPYKENFVAKIKSITFIGEQEVFDCRIPGIEEFCANNINVHNCSELVLSAFDSCRLLLLNLLSYVSNSFTKDAKFDFDSFFSDAAIAQRLMDDIVDLEVECIERIIDKIDSDPETDEIKYVERNLWKNVLKYCKLGRRTGTGITALGDVLAACNLKYDSDEAIKLTEKIYRTLKHACYSSSIDMAEELGAFPIWNAEKEKDHPFLNRLRDEQPDLYAKMMRVGRRNIALLTTAPAGTVSNLAFSGIDGKTRVFGTTSGIEPAFMLSYVRRKKITGSENNVQVDFLDQNGDRWQNFEVVHPPIATWRAITGKQDVKESPWFGSCAEELDWRQRVKLQATATKHLEHSISSTLNLPSDVSVEKVAEIFETAWKSGCKGITIYRNGCRSGVLIESAKQTDKIVKTKAAKRPKNLSCDIHHLTVKGIRNHVLVGLLEGEPYEIMVTRKDVFPRFSEGKLKKVRRGHYELILPDNSVVDGVNECDADQEALLRMTSTALRHGADIGFVVHQLEKTKGDMLGFAKCVARALKKYVKDGTAVSGEQCPDCGGQSLIRQEGCTKCQNCPFSRCS